MNCINYNNKLYFIKKNHNETKNSFNERIWYIIDKMNEKNNYDLEDIINMSNIYINEKKLKCKYD